MRNDSDIILSGSVYRRWVLTDIFLNSNDESRVQNHGKREKESRGKLKLLSQLHFVCEMRCGKSFYEFGDNASDVTKKYEYDLK